MSAAELVFPFQIDFLQVAFLAGLLIAVVLLVYLTYAMLRPEKF